MQHDDEDTSPEIGAFEAPWQRWESELQPILAALNAERGRPRDGGGIGALWVSDAERRTFGELRDRWSRLEAWGVGDKLATPSHRQTLTEWRDYKARWDAGDEEPEKLGYHTSLLTVTENHAKALGYDKPPGQVSPPDPEKEAPIFSAIDAAAKAAERAGVPLPTANAPAEARQGLEQAGAAARSFWKDLPAGVKWGGAAVAGGVVLTAAASALQSLRALVGTARA